MFPKLIFPLFFALLCGAVPLQAEPAVKPAVKPAAEAKAKPAVPQEEVPLLFDEDNKTFPLERFKTARQGSSEWQMGQRWTWHETIQLVRPTKIGTTAELAAQLEFPPLAADGDQAETRLGFVFADGQIGSVAFVRTRQNGKTAGEIRVLREMGGPQPLGLTVRSLPQKADLSSGSYTLRVRCGAVSISLDGKELGFGCFETHFAPAMGLVISQEKGKASCLRLTLRGAGFPEQFPAEQLKKLKEASALNDEGMSLFKDKKLDESLAKTKEALEIYRKVHGDKHNDVANSLHNVATVLRSMEQPAEAIPFYEEAIKIRRKLFGEDHPDVALLEMELTSLLVGRQKLEMAFPHCLRAFASYERFYGSEDKRTIVTQQMLDKLPRPMKADET